MPKLQPLVYDEKRRHILTVARMVFAQRGYQGATIKDITSAAGVSNGALFIYFQSKRDILLAIIAENLGAFCDRIDAIVAVSQKHAFEEILVMLLELVRNISLGPGRAMSLHAWSAAMIDPCIKEELDLHFSRILKSLEQLVRQASACGQLAEHTPPKSTAQALFAVFIPGYILQLLMFPLMEPRTYLRAHRNLWAAPSKS